MGILHQAHASGQHARGRVSHLTSTPSTAVPSSAHASVWQTAAAWWGQARRHPIRLSIGPCLAVLLTVFLLTQARRVPSGMRFGWAAYWCLIVLLALSAVAPRIAGIGMTVAAVLSIPLFWSIHMSPYVLTSLIPWCVAWLVGVLAMTARPLCSVPCCLLICASYLIPRYELILQAGLAVPDMDAVLACIAACAMGYAVRVRFLVQQHAAQDNELLRLRAQAERTTHMRSVLRVQRMIHDTVADRLVYMTLATRPGHAQLTDSDITVLHQYAVAALTNVRQAIALLAASSNDAAEQAVAATPVTMSDALPEPVEDDAATGTTHQHALDQLVAILQYGDHDLHRLGFLGESELDQNTDVTIPSAIVAVTAAVLREIYANIAAHGNADHGQYHIGICCDAQTMRITADNEIGQHPQLDDLLTSGTGLEACRRQLAPFGGTLDVAQEGSMFTINVELPLREVRASASAR